MSNYPQFFRKGSRCIMREGDTYGEQVELFEPCHAVSLIHTRVTLPNKQRFDDMVKSMEPVSEDVYEKYLSFVYDMKRKHPKLFKSKKSMAQIRETLKAEMHLV